MTAELTLLNNGSWGVNIPTVAATAEAGAVTANVVSFGRNATSAMAQFGVWGVTAAKISTFVTGTLFCSGIIGIGLASRLTYNACVDLRKDIKNVNVISGAKDFAFLSFGVSYLLVAGMILGLAAGAGAAVALTFGTVALPCLYTSLFVYAAGSLVRNIYFRHTFLKDLASDPNKFLQLLEDISFDPESPPLDLSSEAIQKHSQDHAILKEKIVSNTSVDCYNWLVALSKKPILQAMEEKDNVITELYRANSKEMLKNNICIVISGLGATAVAVPATMPILFAVSAIIWMFIDSKDANRWIGNKVYGESLVPEEFQNKDPGFLLNCYNSIKYLFSWEESSPEIKSRSVGSVRAFSRFSQSSIESENRFVDECNYAKMPLHE